MEVKKFLVEPAVMSTCGTPLKVSVGIGCDGTAAPAAPCVAGAALRCQLRFQQDLVRGGVQLPSRLLAEVATADTASPTLEVVFDLPEGIEASAISPSATESLALLEVVLIDSQGQELTSKALVVDIRRSSEGVQHGFLSAFR
mmetsp:Transcript_14480/g.32001  ORF Transcript_14480/g.32001 Transcript_14480/m.32001 type:complete len:143 (-) Transcript_14480:78-506(-)